MEIYETQAEIASRKNWFLSLLVITLVAFGTLVLLQGIAVVLIPPIFQISVDELMSLVGGDYSVPNGRMALLFAQGLGSGLGFWLATWGILRYLEKADLGWTKQLSRVNGKNLAWVTAMTVGGMLFNGLLMYWNSLLILPEFLSGVEQWMRDMETQLMELTQFLTDFQSIPELLAGILVIGVLAGVGEELFFRGLIQPKLQGYFRSPHWGIWVTAIVFSAIHVQFYGFLPRLFLGALFGYLYHYTGSLFYPILGHILNNALTLLLVYWSNQGVLELDVQSTDTVSYPGVVVGILVLNLGVRYFKKVNKGKDEKLDQSI
jgi:membrane protease YdiL (CAAX protease family)